LVEVEYQPVKRIIVHEIIKNTFDEFVSMFAVSAIPRGTPIPVRWIDGVLFGFRPFEETPEIVRDRLQGIIHWSFLNFTQMKEYTEVLHHPKNGTPVAVLDNSNNTAVCDVIKWLKKQRQWFSDSGI